MTDRSAIDFNLMPRLIYHIRLKPDKIADADSLFSMPVYEQKAQSADMCCSLI